MSLCNKKILGKKWHGLISRQLKSNTRWLEEAEADYLTEPHQRLKFPNSYLIAATGRQNLSKGRMKSRVKKEMNSAINSLVF